MRRIVSVSVVAALAVALGACGSSSTKAVSKEEFVTQADAVCKAGEAKIAKVTAGLAKSPSLAQIKTAYVDDLVPLFRDEVDALRALEPPAADKDEVDRMLDDLSAGVDEAKASIERVNSAADLEKLAEPAGLKTAAAEAKAYGLPACGSE